MTGENGGIASRQDLMRMTTEIVSAFISRNSVSSSALTTIIGQVHETLHALAQSNAQEAEAAASRSLPFLFVAPSTPTLLFALRMGAS